MNTLEQRHSKKNSDMGSGTVLLSHIERHAGKQEVAEMIISKGDNLNLNGRPSKNTRNEHIKPKIYTKKLDKLD